MRPRLRLVATSLLTLGLAFAFAAGSSPQHADLTESADLRLFDPGNIIDDDVFYNAGTMDVAKIQAFLTAKGDACSGDLCLKNYRQATTDQPADDRCRGAYAGAPDETAAQIIYKVARACVINPQALLVVLQKEQGLITTKTPEAKRLDRAMGYKCPDTAPCDPQYFGFFNQVYNAAWQYNSYRVYPARFGHRAGVTNNVRYHPNSACGTVPVYIQNQATAGLYNYTPYVPNEAALRAGYGTGDGCSAYGNRNFFQYFVDWFGSTQSGPSSIDDKYSHLRASGVDLGGSTSAVTCDLPWGGCWRSYQGGTIFWHRDTGPHVVRGAILQRYLALGGVSLLGYPTGDDTAAPFGTGYFTDFQGGAIHWSHATGAWEVRGALLATWRAKGAQAGVLGYPVGGDEAVPGGFRSRFQGGTLYWSAPTAARMIRGALLQKYEAAGGPRVLGFPRADERATARSGAAVDLTGGAVYWSSATGAHVVRGDIFAKWRRTGGESGPLGFPTSSDTAVPGGYQTTFQGGAVYWSPRTGARVLGTALLERYVAHGGPRVLGFPTTDEVAAAGGGRKVEVQGGAIYWSQATGAHVVRGDILAKWRRTGGESGVLGFPTGSDTAVPGGYQTTFQGGAVYWSPHTGARLLRTALLGRYVAHGGPRVLGFPLADQVAVPGGGGKVELQGGAIYWSRATGAHVVRGDILATWRQWGAQTGALGFPTGDDAAAPGGGYLTTFQGGTIYWSATTGAKVLRGAILERYVAYGGPRVLGYPTTHDVPAANGGAKAHLQRGAIYWSQATGAHVVRGIILGRWRQLGGEAGFLGYPTGDQTAVLGGLGTDFRGGSIWWSSATGVRVVEGPAARAHADLGGPTSYLGFPTRDTRAVSGGRRTDFQGGYVMVTADGRVSAHRS